MHATERIRGDGAALKDLSKAGPRYLRMRRASQPYQMLYTGAPLAPLAVNDCRIDDAVTKVNPARMPVARLYHAVGTRSGATGAPL
jgi:hypothetical protein